MQEEYPAFLVAPQCPKQKRWVDVSWAQGVYRLSDLQETAEMAAAIALLQAVIKEFPIDPARVYVTGQSMGGFKAWETPELIPWLFAQHRAQ